MQNLRSNTSSAEARATMDKSKIGNQVNNSCEDCQKKIPKARLRVVPNARFCVKCQAGYEHDHPFDDSIYLEEPDASELRDIISQDD